MGIFDAILSGLKSGTGSATTPPVPGLEYAPEAAPGPLPSYDDAKAVLNDPSLGSLARDAMFVAAAPALYGLGTAQQVGQTVAGLPALAQQAHEEGPFGSGGQYSDATLGGALNAASMFGMASAPIPRPAGSLGIFGGRRAAATAAEVPAAGPANFTAYHGSPHDFDAFDLSKFDTGEGVGSLGHGVNLAAEERVARQYRDGLANPDGLPPTYVVGGETLLPPAQDQDLGGPYLAAQMALQRGYPDAIRSLTTGMLSGAPGAAEGAEALRGWNGQPIAEKTLGHLYEVNVGADPSHFMDWRSPIGEQSAQVQKSVVGLGYDPSMTGREVMQAHTAAHAGNQALASEALRDAGVPGITFPGDRNMSWGNHKNYVVFDPSTLSILRKYGFAGLSALGAGAGALGAMDDTSGSAAGG